MATYTDYALAEYQRKLDQEAAADAAADQALVDAARQAITPLVTDSAGKVALALDKWTADLVARDNGLVVLTATDGAGVSFGVHPHTDPVQRELVTLVDGQWQRGARVASMADVGAVLAGGAA